MEKEKVNDSKKTSASKETTKKVDTKKKTSASKETVKKAAVAKKTSASKETAKKVEPIAKPSDKKAPAHKAEVSKTPAEIKETVVKEEKVEPVLRTVEKRKVSRKKKRESKVGEIIALIIIIIISAYLGWLFANATESTYDVAFMVDGVQSTMVKVEEENNVLKPQDPTREGYVFAGWYNGDVKFDFSTKITEDITLTAKWTKIEEPKPVTFTVTFDSMTGNSVAVQTIESGKLAVEPSKPTRSGYTFAGWYNGSVKYDFSAPVTTNMTLTAKWTKIEENKTDDKTDNKTDNKTETVTKYTVKFNYGYSNKVTTKSVEKGKTVAQPSKPSRSGYTFLGWYNGSTKFDFSTKITNNITLTAKWQKKDVISYKIEEIPSSTLKQVRLYLTLNGKAVAGTADVINTQGQTIHVTVPASGLVKFVKGTIKSVTNIKVK